MKLPSKSFLLLAFLFLICIGFSFNVNNYLYPEENESILSQETIFVDDQEYSLVTLDNTTPIFLLKSGELEGEPVEEQEEIESVIYNYYKDLGYPNDEELEEVKSLILAFNQSRANNGSSVMGLKEEKLCLANLFIITIKRGEIVDLFPCYDQESCDWTEMMFCSAIGEQPFSMCRPGDLIEDIKLISFASTGLDNLVHEFYGNISNYTEDTLYSNLVYIKDNLDEVETYSEEIESSIFQTPPTIGDYCFHQTFQVEILCFQICGRLDLGHEEIVPELESKLDAMLTKLEPFSKYKETSETIYTETTDRLQYHVNVGLRDDYLSLYEPEYEEAQELILEVNETLNTKIMNQSLKNSMDELGLFGEDIKSSLNNFNFTDIDDKLDDYTDLINETESKLSSTMLLYNNTMESKSTAELYLFILDLKDLDDTLQQELLDVEAVKLEIDENLTQDVPTVLEMQQINSSYALVIDSLESILQKQEENILFLQLRSFARKVNTNLNSLLEALNGFTYDKRVEYSQSMPLFLSILNLVTLSCLGTFLFLAVSCRIRFRRFSHLALYFGLLFLFALFILVFSIGFYFYLDKTTNSADLNEFLLSISEKNNTAIVLALDNVSEQTSLSMMECAEDLSLDLEAYNKTTDIYQIKDGCIKNNIKLNNVSSQDCLSKVDSPIFYFNYSTVDTEPIVTSIFLDQLMIVGDKEYYDKCEIASVFKVVSFEN